MRFMSLILSREPGSLRASSLEQIRGTFWRQSRYLSRKNRFSSLDGSSFSRIRRLKPGGSIVANQQLGLHSNDDGDGNENGKKYCLIPSQFYD